MEVNVMEEESGRERRPPIRFSPKPVKLGDSVTLNVEAIGEKGDGVAKIEGYVIFVKGATQSDVGKQVKANITFIGRKFAIAEKTG
ncbi:MAG: TRAM domain-containing protein [Candidatus Micrarchaeia archaeon]